MSSIESDEKRRLAGAFHRRIVPPDFRSKLAFVTQEQGVLLIAAALGLFFLAFQPGFASWGNLMALLRSVSVLGVLSLGMAVVIIGRGIDLSLIAVALVSTGITVKLVLLGIGLPISILVGFISAIALGLVNGAIVAFLKIPALFATLATSFLFVGAARSTILTSMITNLPTDNVALMSLGQNWLGIPALTAGDNIYIASLKSRNGWSFFYRPVDRDKVANAWIKKLSIASLSLEAKIIEYSGGNQQKVVIAKSLAQDPDVIFFDEPTHGVDVGAIPQMHDAIRALANEGKAVVVISSYMREILGISDRVLVIRSGRVVEEFEAGTATEDKIMFAAAL